MPVHLAFNAFYTSSQLIINTIRVWIRHSTLGRARYFWRDGVTQLVELPHLTRLRVPFLCCSQLILDISYELCTALPSKHTYKWYPFGYVNCCRDSELTRVLWTHFNNNTSNCEHFSLHPNSYHFVFQLWYGLRGCMLCSPDRHWCRINFCHWH